MAIKGNGNKMISSGNYLGNISRTKCKNIWDFRTTFSAGFIFPIYAREIYPSMNGAINCSELVRSITPLGPTMDNAFLDIFFFFVPSRLLWDHWEEFIAGYNKEAWAQDVEYSVPQIKFKAVGDEITDKNMYLSSFLDYLPQACDVVELPYLQKQAYDGDTTEGTYTSGTYTKALNDLCSISALYPRAYVKIWNDWFRDENLQDELELYTGDNDEYADEFAFDLLDPTTLPKACKLHNRFTSCLPAPIKGPDVLIPMNNLPISVKSLDAVPKNGTRNVAGYNITDNTIASGGELPVGVLTTEAGSITGASQAYATNVSNTIRMLRLATQTELLLSRDARGGTRYVESILSHFKTHNGDARLQRSEYLGSRSIPLNVQQITNTSQADGNALGNVGGQSMTKDSHFYFSKGFSEWGIVLGLAVVRTNLSYSSGIHKQYQRKGRFDFIWPEFKHVGDVPLLKREHDISQEFLTDLSLIDGVFGYTPYGSELRTGLNFNNGLFRAKANGSLAYLTYQESYASDNDPTLSDDYIQQQTIVVGNTLISQSGPQYYALFHIEEELVIPLDPTSDPGLMDHF